MLAHQLLVPPVLGLADNGDFSRLWGHFGIRAQWLPPDERYFAYLVREWLVDPASATSTGFWSPDTLLLRLSLLVNPLFAEEGRYDIRSLGVLRIALFAGASLLLVDAAARRGSVAGIATIAVLAVVFADATYVASFNSGYSEPATLLFGLYVVALYVRTCTTETRSRWSVLGFVLAACLLTLAKPQNVLLAIPLALCAVRLGTLREGRRGRMMAAWGATAVLATAVCARALPPPLWYQQQVRHIAVFNAILPASGDPSATLADLGLPAGLADLSGRYPWDPEALRRADELQRTLHANVSNADIARHLAARPSLVRHLLGLAAPRALALRVGLGHYEASAGRGPHAAPAAYTLRTDVVGAIGPRSLRALALVGIAILGVAAAFRLRSRTPGERALADGLAGLVACAVLAYATVATLQGHLSEEKGMLPFAFFADASFLAACAMLAALVRRAGARGGRRASAGGAPA